MEFWNNAVVNEFEIDIMGPTLCLHMCCWNIYIMLSMQSLSPVRLQCYGLKQQNLLRSKRVNVLFLPCCMHLMDSIHMLVKQQSVQLCRNLSNVPSEHVL